MRARALVTVAILSLLTLTGCVPSLPAPGPAPADSSNTSDSPGGAEVSDDVAPWAKVISPQAPEWADWRAKWDEKGCTAAATNADDDSICRAWLFRLAPLSQFDVLEQKNATTEGDILYIAAEPPAEIAELWGATVTAVRATFDAAEAWKAGNCTITAGDGCAELATVLEAAGIKATDLYARWEPYI